MVQLLGLVLLSFAVTSFLMVPFIDLLFYLRRKYKKKIATSENDYNPLYNKLMAGKDETGTPVGGGLPIIFVITLLSGVIVFFTSGLNLEIKIIILTVLLFGLIGFIDDIRKIFADFRNKIYPGLRGRYIILLQILFAGIIACLLHFGLGFNNIYLPIFNNVILGFWYIPLAIFVIVSFSNAYNIADGLDGLAAGLLLICLFAFLVLASSVFDNTLAIFVGLWIGALIAYLYFNIYPARIYLGDAGAYAFGATLGLIGLLTGKIFGLALIGSIYIIIIITSLVQITSKKVFKKKVFPIAPIHLYLRYIGWEEPKIVVRLWLAGAIFAILGLWLSLLPH